MGNRYDHSCVKTDFMVDLCSVRKYQTCMHYAVLYGASHKLSVGSACAMWGVTLN